jgi:transposase
MKEAVTLSVQDQRRLKVLEELDQGHYTAGQAAQLWGCSLRHMRRRLAQYRQDHLTSLPHGNRGRRPAHALPEDLRQEVLALTREQYQDYNNHHLQEVLAQDHRLFLSVSSLRRLRLQAGLPSPRKRRAPKHRSRRPRQPQAGMMLQVDGSAHPWLGPAHPSFALLAAIDDATNEVFALFREHEDTVGYLLLLQEVIRQKGLPLSLYSDRHTIFRSPKQDKLTVEEQLAGAEPQTQFSRASRELGIRIIPAHSPQAKGRVENLFGTLQDRLVAELQHAHLSNLPQAQEFLPGFLERYNARFRKPPPQPQAAFLPRPSRRQLARSLCLKFERTVQNDHTISLGNRPLALPRTARSRARTKVTVQLALDGQISFWKDDTCLGRGPTLEGPLPATPSALAALLPPESPPAQAPAPPPPTRPRSSGPLPPPIPAPDHPWRRFRYGKASPRMLQ